MRSTQNHAVDWFRQPHHVELTGWGAYFVSFKRFGSLFGGAKLLSNTQFILITHFSFAGLGRRYLPRDGVSSFFKVKQPERIFGMLHVSRVRHNILNHTTAAFSSPPSPPPEGGRCSSNLTNSVSLLLLPTPAAA